MRKPGEMAFYEEYQARPEDFHFERITTPRLTWQEAGGRLTRQPLGSDYMPGVFVMSEIDKPGICWRYTSWHLVFYYQCQKIDKGGYASEHDAAMAHDAYVIEHGLKRKLFFPDAQEQEPGVTGQE